MRLSPKCKRPLSILLVMAFLLTLSINPVGQQAAQAADLNSIWTAFENIWSYVDKQEEYDAMNAALGNFRNPYHEQQAKNTLLWKLLETEETWQVLADNAIDTRTIDNIISSLASIDYQNPNNRNAQIESFKSRHHKIMRDFFGPDVSAEDLLELILTLFSGLPTDVDNDRQIEAALLSTVGKNASEFSAARAELLELGLVKLRAKNSTLNQSLDNLGWTNALLKEVALGYADLCDPSKKATTAVMMTQLRRHFSLGGSDGLKLVANSGTYWPASIGTMTVAASNNPLDIKAYMLGQDISSNINWQVSNLYGTNAVANAANKLVTKEPGFALITLSLPNNSYLGQFSIIVNEYTGPGFLGEGTNSNPFLIYSKEDLKKLADYINGNNATYAKDGQYYKLMNNLDLASYANWVPIGIDANSSFAGNFMGNNKIITNLKINSPNTDYQGLFGYCQGNINDLTLQGVKVIGRNYVGGLAGYLGGYRNISACSSNGTVTGANDVGGLFGSVFLSCKINNSYSIGSVTGTERVGGLAGAITFQSSVNNSYSSANVIGDTNVGGLIGFLAAESVVQNCYSSGFASATKRNAGGLVGIGRYLGYVVNSVALNSLVLTQDHKNGGRVLGFNDGIDDMYTILQGNFAYENMIINFVVTTPISYAKDGANADISKIKSVAFWKDRGFTAANWELKEGQLPLLKNSSNALLLGQSASLPTHLQ